VCEFEYRIPIAPHVSASLFGDIGATGALRHDQLQLNSADLSTLQSQFRDAYVEASADAAISARHNFKLRSTVGVELVVQLPLCKRRSGFIGDIT